MAVDTKYEELIAELKAARIAETTQIRNKIGALEAALTSLKIQVENAPTPQAVDYSELEAEIAEIKNMLPDDPEPTESPTTTPLLPNSDASLTDPDASTAEAPNL